mmetsp:Transcript_5046/g.12564  ORF Transcript_5046/g.12564 Transcript_5046/m.12564 type:complete len:297 (-) Transcript_5046:427-1317(-)
MTVCQHDGPKQVVLTIRGTFSVSGIVTDLAGYCEDFCGGQAHSGMAMAAYETWQTVWNPILRPKLERLPQEYKLVITGHSLGAGVACLVTILVHHLRATNPINERLQCLQGRDIECFAMAPPPVFAPLSAAPQAVQNTLAFVHQYDIVPSLSVDAIRKLMACLGRLQDVLDDNPVWEFALERLQRDNDDEVKPELVDAYNQKHVHRQVSGAPLLLIPARRVIWMEKDPQRLQDDTDENDEDYLAHALDPQLYADRVLDLELPDCVANHLTPEYEVAFARLLERLQREGVSQKSSSK